jgi:hypothetical protein
MSKASPVLLLARAAGGAILFSLPIMMTMEMWWLGMYMQSKRDEPKVGQSSTAERERSEQQSGKDYCPKSASAVFKRCLWPRFTQLRLSTTPAAPATPAAAQRAQHRRPRHQSVRV